MTALRENPEVIYGAVAAFVIVILLTPAVGGMARLLGVVDRPEARRLNPNPIPRLGGLAIFFGIFVPALAFLELGPETRGVLLGAAVATVVGAIDDFRVLKPGRKLAGQVIAAAIPPFFGVWIDHFTFPFLGPVDLPSAVGVPLTMVWIVAVASIGFLRHNFFPARIFMGDSGALGLGFLLAAVSVQGLLKTASTVVLLLPLLVLAVPIIDTSFVVARRLKHGQRISSPDQAHLHFRFLRRGYSQRRAAVIMWVWCATLAGAALATRFIPFREGGDWHPWETLAVVAIALVALVFSLYVVYVLEIVKSTNPRRFRLGPRHEPVDEQRRSA